MPVRHLTKMTITAGVKTASLTILIFLFACTVWGQTAPNQPPSPPQAQSSTPPQPPASPAQPQSPATPASPSSAQPQQSGTSQNTQVPGTGASVQNQQQGSGNDQAQPQSENQSDQGENEPETRITKQQAKDLFRSVDEILQFVSGDTGLPIEHKVKRHLITRESVEKYVDKRMKDDKDAKRLEQSRLVLQKFGLLPPGYDLHAEFLRLLAEQVAAYYDPKTQEREPAGLGAAGYAEAGSGPRADPCAAGPESRLGEVGTGGRQGRRGAARSAGVFRRRSAGGATVRHRRPGQAVLFDYTLAPMGKRF